MKVFLTTLVVAAAITLSLSAQTAPAATGLVNPDTATEQQLAALPHMNATLAKAVIGKRPFKTMLDVNAVLSPTLSQQQRTELYARMFKPIDLNTATREEMLLIPGLGNRMVREFEEYRPYTAMAQFRREMGKYVDQKEVARLEQYVSIK
jgi:DNA uptake protein ComE-like DNA-binding protein